MFKRFALNFVLIFLFAFAQIGAATHEISHIEDLNKHNQAKHSQDDKNSHKGHCAQCLSYAEVAGGLWSQPFTFHFATAEFSTVTFQQLSYPSLTYTAYAARAPPQLL
jgi:hypothetical protein